MPRRRWRALGSVGLGFALLAACAKPPQSWQRPDVNPETARAVEFDCHQRAVEAIGPGNNPDDTKSVHQRREDYFQRCMRASGFELR